MEKKITFGSVCSGIEAASVAWEPLGMSPVWFSEIESFPSAVLKHHWPDIPNKGDFTKIRDDLDFAPDILVGGTPCQAFSVSGARKGLDDDRGKLTLEFVRLADEIDERRRSDGIAECVICWENVPGVFSSKDNAFGCFLGALAGEDCEIKPSGEKWTNAGCVYGPKRAIAWRVLDAQYFGVAQRRRRVFVVASARKGFDPAKVLFESEGLRRDIKPSKDERRYNSKKIDGSFGSHSETIGCLMARDYKGVGNQYVTEGKILITNGIPRRPTPKEYELLQGFPEEHTSVPYRKKPSSECPDGPRYKAIGNSMAVPVMRWLGTKIMNSL